MKILVTGPNGFVGARIMSELGDAIPAPSLRGADEDTIKRLVDTVRPDCIIHTAAISDIQTCEQNADASYHANVRIPVWLAETGVKTVIFSTDQVYSGCDSDGPYTEEEVKPANLYARHKLEMEQRTLEACPDTVLLRATWMYDMPMYGYPNRGNFLCNMLLKPEIAFSSTQHRAVTYVREVAAQVEAPRALHLHTSGTVPMDVFGEDKPHAGVLYFFQSFSKASLIEDWSRIPVFVEGRQIDDVAAIYTLAQTLTSRVFECTQHDRERLHVAGVFANNFTNLMYGMAADLLGDTQIPFQVLLPLIDQTAEKVHTLTPREAQTGPAKRDDRAVMAHHVSLLNDDQRAVYELLSRLIAAR